LQTKAVAVKVNGFFIVKQQGLRGSKSFRMVLIVKQQGSEETKVSEWFL